MLQRESKVLGQIYAHRVRDWHNEQVELRGYVSPIAVRNVSNDVPDRAVEILLDVDRAERAACSIVTSGSRRRDWGRSACVASTSTRRSAKATAASSTRTRSPPCSTPSAASIRASRARRARVFDGAHIDSEIRTGKRGGAFCASVLPRLHALAAHELHRHGCATWRRSRTSSATPSTACWRRTTRCSPSIPRCRWRRPPRCSPRCW